MRSQRFKETPQLCSAVSRINPTNGSRQEIDLVRQKNENAIIYPTIVYIEAKQATLMVSVPVLTMQFLSQHYQNNIFLHTVQWMILLILLIRLK